MEWDLSHLCADDSELDSLLEAARKEASAFQKKYKGNLDSLSDKEFVKSVETYEDILEKIGRGMSYVYLQFAVDTSKGGYFAKYNELSNAIHEDLLFYELEFNLLKGSRQDAFIEKAKKYAYHLTLLKEGKKHQLGFKEERVLLKKEPVSVSAFSRLFDEHLSRVKFKFGREELGEEEVLSKLYDADRNVRKRASKSLTNGLEPHLPLLAYIFNMVKTDTRIETSMRQYKSPEQPRHKSNQISQKSVDALVKTAESHFDLVSTYYGYKKKLLGVKELYEYDRYAPFGKSEKEFTFDESRDLILEAFDEFHPEFYKIAKKAFDERWIDAFPRDGKRGGAFSHSTVPGVHPYVMLNHTNRRRDIFTIAHELGHAIHQYLARDVGYLNTDTPLTTAETASVFAEMLLFEKIRGMLEGEELISLVGGKLEDIFATLYRQIIFTTFERRVHAHEGEVDVDTFSQMWIEENRKMFGDSVTLTDDYRTWWSYIPHFVHSPFYCYAYSYGQLLVLALFGLYHSGFDGFEKRYIKLLSAGGSKAPEDLVSLFGFDIEDERFWEMGVNEVKALLDSFGELTDG